MLGQVNIKDDGGESKSKKWLLAEFKAAADEKDNAAGLQVWRDLADLQVGISEKWQRLCASYADPVGKLFSWKLDEKHAAGVVDNNVLIVINIYVQLASLYWHQRNAEATKYYACQAYGLIQILIIIGKFYDNKKLCDLSAQMLFVMDTLLYRKETLYVELIRVLDVPETDRMEISSLDVALFDLVFNIHKAKGASVLPPVDSEKFRDLLVSALAVKNASSPPPVTSTLSAAAPPSVLQQHVKPDAKSAQYMRKEAKAISTRPLVGGYVSSHLNMTLNAAPGAVPNTEQDKKSSWCLCM
jgi:hypothetical protein